MSPRPAGRARGPAGRWDDARLGVGSYFSFLGTGDQKLLFMPAARDPYLANGRSLDLSISIWEYIKIPFLGVYIKVVFFKGFLRFLFFLDKFLR